jgi:hypothetical protein
MTSQAIRDPLADHLITRENAAFILIDYQPSQFATVRSMDEALLRKNIVSTVKTARALGLPIVHSTVNVGSGQQQPTVPELAELLADSTPLDRTTVNSWEDTEFVHAVPGLERVVQAGAQPVSWVSLACELQRDWARLETVPAIVEIVLTDRLLQE